MDVDEVGGDALYTSINDTGLATTTPFSGEVPGAGPALPADSTPLPTDEDVSDDGDHSDPFEQPFKNEFEREEDPDDEFCGVDCACTTIGLPAAFAAILLLLAIGLLFCAFFFPPLAENALEHAIDDFIYIDSRKAQGYKRWENTTAPQDGVDRYVYFFDILNKQEILSQSKPVAVRQKGPYIYRQHQLRLNVSWDYASDTMSYRTWTYYVFDRESTPSHLSEDDVITTINIPFFHCMSFAERKDGVGVDQINFFAPKTDEERLFTSRSVKELLFGYLDPTWLAVHLGYPKLVPLQWTGLMANTTSPKDASPLFDTIRIGKKNPKMVRQYVKFQGIESLLFCDYFTGCNASQLEPAYRTPEANRVHGTDGGQFKRYVKSNQNLPFWLNFREVDLVNQGGELTYRGVSLLRYVLDPKAFLNLTSYPPNAAYDYDWADGLWNLSQLTGLPEVYSQPHFLDVGEPVHSMVTGMVPNRQKHSTVFGVEPLTGTPFLSYVRLQMNWQVQAKPKFGYFKDLPRLLIPVYWFSTGASISKSAARDFVNNVYFLDYLVKFIELGGLIGGCSLLVFAIFFIMLACRRHKEVGSLKHMFARFDRAASLSRARDEDEIPRSRASSLASSVQTGMDGEATRRLLNHPDSAGYVPRLDMFSDEKKADSHKAEGDGQDQTQKPRRHCHHSNRLGACLDCARQLIARARMNELSNLHYQRSQRTPAAVRHEDERRFSSLVPTESAQQETVAAPLLTREDGAEDSASSYTRSWHTDSDPDAAMAMTPRRATQKVSKSDRKRRRRRRKRAALAEKATESATAPRPIAPQPSEPDDVRGEIPSDAFYESNSVTSGTSLGYSASSADAPWYVKHERAHRDRFEGAGAGAGARGGGAHDIETPRVPNRQAQRHAPSSTLNLLRNGDSPGGAANDGAVAIDVKTHDEPEGGVDPFDAMFDDL